MEKKGKKMVKDGVGWRVWDDENGGECNGGVGMVLIKWMKSCSLAPGFILRTTYCKREFPAPIEFDAP